jgi:hypothetical protein
VSEEVRSQMSKVQKWRWVALCGLAVLAAPAEDRTRRDFLTRVEEYVRVRAREDAALPRLWPGASADAITEHQHELAARIRARRTARQGEIFTPAVAAWFRRLIAITMQGAEARRIRQSLLEAEPVRIPLAVNQVYPEGVPLESTPPSLLVNLPPLPKAMDYRVVGRRLVLRDAEANLVVDFVPEALP